MTITALLVIPAGAANDVSFEFDVLLSAKAAREMAFTGQKLGVSILFYGFANKASQSKADSMGQIYLGEENTSLPARGGIVVVAGRNLKTSNLKYLEGEPKVNVNVFSTLRGSPQNILDCEVIGPDIPQSGGDLRQLHCKLIGEK